MATKSNAKAKVKAKAKTKAAVTKKAVKPAPKKVAAKATPIKSSPVKKSSSVSLTAVITPLEDRVIIAVSAPEEVTAGGLIIPGSATENPNRGRVVAAGPGRRSKKGRLRPLDVAVGDEVLFAQYSGTKIVVGSADYLILREDDVLGIVT